jgi:hypothetical protein
LAHKIIGAYEVEIVWVGPIKVVFQLEHHITSAKETISTCKTARQGEPIFQKSLKFENRHVDLDHKKNSKTILQNTFLEILSRFLRK